MVTWVGAFFIFMIMYVILPNPTNRGIQKKHTCFLCVPKQRQDLSPVFYKQVDSDQ